MYEVFGRDTSVAMNSAILLLTNMVAIILAAASAFALLGIRGSGTEAGILPWVQRAFLVLIMLTAILLLPLTINVVEQKRLGQTKPLTYPVAAHVQEAVTAYVDSIPNVTLVRLARVSVEPASAINILLATPTKLPAGTRDELIRIVHEVRGGNPSVRVIALREVLEEVAPQP